MQLNFGLKMLLDQTDSQVEIIKKFPLNIA